MKNIKFIILILLCSNFIIQININLSPNKAIGVEDKQTTVNSTSDWFTAETIRVNDSYYRLTKHYLSSNILESKLAYNPAEDLDQLILYLPLYLEFSYSVPTIDWEYDSDSNLIAYNLSQGTTYTFFFCQGVGFGRDYIRRENYVAISESEAEFTYINGNKDYNYPFDSVTDNYTIVYDEPSSLRLSSSSTGTYAISNKDNFLEPHEYYISFSYYVESFSGTAFKLDAYIEGSIQTIRELDTTVTDRWITEFLYVTIDGSESDTNFMFWFQSASGTIFLSNVRFYTADTTCVTSDYETNVISGSVISWDTWSDPGVATDITVKLKIRENDTEVYSQDLKTDSDGSFSITLSYADFEPQKLEYEIFVLCIDSAFSTKYDFTSTYVFDPTNWGGAIDVIATEYNNRIEITCTYGNPKLSMPESEYDLNDVDAIKLVFSSNQSGSSFYFYLYTENDYSDYYKSIVDYETNIMKSYTVLFTDLSPKTDPDWTKTYAYGGMWLSVPQKIVYYDIHFIQAQRSYFTPKVADEVSNSFFSADFSYCRDNWSNDYRIANETLNDGIFSFSSDGTTAYPLIQLSEILSVDFSYYNSLTLRIKANSSDGAKVRLEFSGGTSASSYSDITEDYNLITLDLTYSEVKSSQWKLRFADLDGSVTESSDWYFIDYVKLNHQITTTEVKTNDYLYLSSDNNTLNYYTTTDNQLYSQDFADLELFYLNSSVASHTFSYTPYMNSQYSYCYLPANTQSYSYTISSAPSVIVSFDYTLQASNSSYAYLQLKPNTTDVGSLTLILYRNNLQVDYYHFDSIAVTEGQYLNFSLPVEPLSDYELQIIYLSSTGDSYSEMVSFSSGIAENESNSDLVGRIIPLMIIVIILIIALGFAYRR